MMFASELSANDRQTHVHCQRYINLLQLAGCDVTFVEHRGIEPPSIPNIHYLLYPRIFRRLEKVLGSTTYRLRQWPFRKLWRSVEPDICHVQWIGDQLWHIARAGLRPLVATAWGSDLNVTAQAPVDDPLRQKISAGLRYLDLLIVDSDDMAATAELLAGRSLKTLLMPIGIDTGAFRPGLHQERNEWRKKLKIDLESIVLISPRQLGANYRPSEIIRAFAATGHNSNKNSYLIMRTFGHRNGVSLIELNRLANELGVSSRIRWVDDIKYAELPGLYAASDLAINFPIIDAFPVTFLECFSCALPVITNRLTSYASNGALPYLSFIEDDSIVGLKTAIELGIKRLLQLQVVAAKAREHVVRNYDEQLTARALSKAYEAVLGRPSI
jgi:glycosyltransferase involved in cell wall biosynthesis